MSTFRLFRASDFSDWPLISSREDTLQPLLYGTEGSLGDREGEYGVLRSETARSKHTPNQSIIRSVTIAQSRSLPEPDSSEDEAGLDSSIYDAAATLNEEMEPGSEDASPDEHDIGSEIGPSSFDGVFGIDISEFLGHQSHGSSPKDGIGSRSNNLPDSVFEETVIDAAKESSGEYGEGAKGREGTVIDFEYASPKKPSWEPPKPVNESRTSTQYRNLLSGYSASYRLTTSSTIASYFLTRERLASQSPPRFRPFPSQYMTHSTHPYRSASFDEGSYSNLRTSSSQYGNDTQSPLERDENVPRWSRRRRYRRFENIHGLSSTEVSDDEGFASEDESSGLSELCNFLCCIPSSRDV